jgi:hypothetical protein
VKEREKWADYLVKYLCDLSNRLCAGDLMAETKLKKIPVGSSSESSHIDSRKRYKVKIEGKWYEGSFSKQWFGWKFEGYGTSGMQLNMIDQVYEIVRVDPKKPKKGPV